MKQKIITLHNTDMSDVGMLSILQYTIPLIASSFLQQLFNSADSAVVGRFVGPQALAAVGGNAPVISLLINLFNGLATGANVVVARYLGEKNEKKISSAVSSILLLGIACGLITGVLGFFVSKPVLVMIDTPYDIIDLASKYLRIYFLGMPFVMIFNFGSAILRSNGETNKPLIILFFSGIANIVLNIFFVVALKMSVAGVGIATVISNVISALLVLLMLLRRNDCLRLNYKNFKPNYPAVKLSLRIGLPAGLQGTVFAISNVVILSAINSFGSFAAAGSTIALLYEQFSYFIVAGFIQATVSFVSHNYGAKEIEKTKKTFKNAFILALVFQASFDVLLFLFRFPLLKIFTDDPLVSEYAIKRILGVTLIHFIIVGYEIPGACLRGYGKSLIPALITLGCCCGIRLAWVAFILPLHRTFSFLFLAYPISWVCCGIAISTAYIIERKRIC